LDDILANLGNKPKKMSTLEKSKLDWDNFKGKKEGIVDDIKYNTKSGYLDKVAFLNRSDIIKEEKVTRAKTT